ncbi:MAG: DUF4276 family protein [Tepidisphaeraceae bacterium]
MRELYVFCEGPTEQGFCNQVLAPHLFPQCNGRIHTIRVANSKSRGVVSRGGIRAYLPLKRDIQNTLKSRHEAAVFFTSLIDLYGLPTDFPGKTNCVRDPGNPSAYAVALETAFCADINDVRFTPYLQLHEFETMLFSDPDAFRISFDGCDLAIESLKQIAASFSSVEHIDDGVETAPSKQIISVLRAYEGLKVSAGPDIAEFIGLAAIRAKCPHVDQWLSQLENLDWRGA